VTFNCSESKLVAWLSVVVTSEIT